MTNAFLLLTYCHTKLTGQQWRSRDLIITRKPFGDNLTRRQPNMRISEGVFFGWRVDNKRIKGEDFVRLGFWRWWFAVVYLDLNWYLVFFIFLFVCLLYLAFHPFLLINENFVWDFCYFLKCLVFFLDILLQKVTLSV